MRVGSTQNQEADVRVIAATNRLPFDAVQTGKLREDLLYRLNVFPIELPPLRERLEDVADLAVHFMAAVSQQEGRHKAFSQAALQRLARHDWPGNVRELRNVVQRAYVMATGDVVDEEWLPAEDARFAAAAAPAPAPAAAQEPGPGPGPSGSATNGEAASSGGQRGAPSAVQPQASAGSAAAMPGGVDNAVAQPAAAGPAPAHISLCIGESIAQAERKLILATLLHYDHHKERTAAALGISLKTLYNRLKEYAAADEQARRVPDA
jgi:DNA-binding NtrC family response regulator